MAPKAQWNASVLPALALAALLGGCQQKLKCDKLCARAQKECRHEMMRYVLAVPKHLTVELMRISYVPKGKGRCEQLCKTVCPKDDQKPIKAANECVDKKSCKDFALCVRERMRRAGTLAKLQAKTDRILALKFGYHRLKVKTVPGPSKKKGKKDQAK